MSGYRLVARIASEIRRDVAAARNRDPAARGVGTIEILATWPGVHALLAHRVAHALYGPACRWCRARSPRSPGR